MLTIVLILLLPSPTILSASKYPICKPGLEFWSHAKSGCSSCTSCAPDFTLSPCAIHKDAICGPLSALELDWSFLASRKRQANGAQSLEAVTSNMLFRFPEIEEKSRKIQGFSGLTDRFEREEGSREEKRDSSEEKILWDWETGALLLAVCACILFFLVAGCSALIYARHWRRMRNNFEPAGLEEISVRLNLMVKAELAELVSGAPLTPGDPETRCQYLEKLLDRKREMTVLIGWPEIAGNFYIEEDQCKSKKLQIARIHRNIESILGQKRGSDDRSMI